MRPGLQAAIRGGLVISTAYHASMARSGAAPKGRDPYGYFVLSAKERVFPPASGRQAATGLISRSTVAFSRAWIGSIASPVTVRPSSVSLALSATSALKRLRENSV